MLNEIEEDFINKFIVKNKRERLKFELNNSKKRKDGIGRFCHNANKLVCNNKIYESGDLSENILLSLIKEYGKDSKSYVIAFNEELDKKFMTHQEVIEKVIGNGMAAVIINHDIAIIETEQYGGNADKIVLIDKNWKWGIKGEK